MLGTAKAQIRFVDGSADECDVDLGKYQRLLASGLRGKRLINTLLTDDWGPPPLVVTLIGGDLGGEEIVIAYD